MQMILFLNIMHKLSETSSYFCERYDASGRAGLTALQKCTGALRQLAYDMATNTIDKYLKLEKTTAASLSVLGMSSYVVLLSLILNVC
jgi:hypothetical protein